MGSQKKITITAICLALVFVIGGCVDYGDPSATVTDMASAMNSADINGVMETFEPGVQRMSEGMQGLSSSIMGAITGIDIDMADVAKVLPGLADLARASGQQLPTMTVAESRWIMDDSHTYSLVLARMASDYPDENGSMQHTEDWVPFLLKRIDGKWKILGTQASIDQALKSWPQAEAELSRMQKTVEPKQ